MFKYLLNLNGYELEVTTKEAIDFTVMIAIHDKKMILNNGS